MTTYTLYDQGMNPSARLLDILYGRGASIATDEEIIELWHVFQEGWEYMGSTPTRPGVMEFGTWVAEGAIVGW